MTPARYNNIIDTAAAQAIDECAGDTPEAIARRAAELAAEWIVEEMAEEERQRGEG